MRTHITLMCLFGISGLFAQWNDSFDQPLDSAWTGDRQHFIINTQLQLQLNAPVAGKSQLLRSFDKRDSMVWSLFFKLDFSPSASNYLKIILMSDHVVWDSAHAYYLEVGENGSNDNWKFFFKDRTTKTLLTEGALARLATDPAQLRMTVVLKQDSIWEINTNYTGGWPVGKEITLNEKCFFPNNSYHFGFICNFTETRKKNFLFDDIVIGQFTKDTVAPQLNTVYALDQHILELFFNESLDTLHSIDTSHFEISGFGFPFSIQNVKSNSCELYFKQEFLPGNSYLLNYNNISDLAGNKNTGSSFNFIANFALIPQYQDLIITEFMADPSPAVGLPEKEYVEIKNRSNWTLNLKDCIFSDESTEVYFGDLLLQADSILILCDISDTAAFKGFGRVNGLQNFPSINNSGDQLQLYNSNFDLIDAIVFDDSWYGPGSKSEGGYALELINEWDLCLGNINWTPSNHFNGGTPGKINSMIILDSLIAPLQLQSIFALNEWEIKLVFNRNLYFTSPFHLEWFKIFPERSLATVEIKKHQPSELIVLLNEPLELAQIYLMQFNGIKDCMAQSYYFNSSSFSLPAEPLPGTLKFSEVLFNPNTGVPDFVEIHNTSNLPVKGANLYLSNPLVSNTWMPLQNDKNILSGSFLAFTEDPKALLEQYPIHDSLNVIATQIPSISDDGGILILASRVQNQWHILDSFQFFDDWHHPFLQDVEGVSLEKIHLNESSVSKFNWQSAAQSTFFATPGTSNSHQPDTLNISSTFGPNLSSKWISPNGDNFQDFLEIRFHLPKSGFNTRMEIFDLSGYRIKKWDSQLLAAEDFTIWYGESDQGFRTPPGNYIIRMELLHPEGDLLQFKELIVVDY